MKNLGNCHEGHGFYIYMQYNFVSTYIYIYIYIYIDDAEFLEVSSSPFFLAFMFDSERQNVGVPVVPF